MKMNIEFDNNIVFENNGVFAKVLLRSGRKTLIHKGWIQRINELMKIQLEEEIIKTFKEDPNGNCALIIEQVPSLIFVTIEPLKNIQIGEELTIAEIAVM